MADPKDNKNDQQPQGQPVDELAVLKAELEALKAAVNGKAAAQAQVAANDGKPATETVPGGLYYLSDGKTLVNAYGRRVDKEGKPLSNDDAYLEQIVIVR